MKTRTTKQNLLTTKAIENAKVEPPNKELWLNDGDCLRLRVLVSGKTWYFRYRSSNSTSTSKTRIGSYPAISLAEARKEAQRLREQRESGLDPNEVIKAEEARKRQEVELQNQQAPKVLTMDELFDLYDANHGVTLEAHNRAVTKSRWKCHISVAIGKMDVLKATKHPVMAHYNQSVKNGKSATPRAALTLLLRVMKWAEQTGYVDENHPLLRLQLPSKIRTISADQLPENFNAKDYLAKHGKEIIGQDGEDDKAGRALQFSELVILLSQQLPHSTQAETGKCMMKLMLATGIRASETIRIRWDWISFDDRVLLLPAGSMKKQKMHHVYLSDYALKQLAAMEAVRINGFVFPASTKSDSPILRSNVGKDITNRQFYRSIDESDEEYEARLAHRLSNRRARTDYQRYNLPGGKWTLYDIRRTVATRFQELGFDEGMVRRVLAHAPQTVTDRYARYGFWPDRCNALDTLGKAIESCEKGTVPLLSGTNVVPMRKSA